MKIKTDKRVISGTHKKEAFHYELGCLQMFGVKWSKEKIKKLVEVANLLEHQGNPVLDAFVMKKTTQETLCGQYESEEECLPGEETADEEDV